MSSIEWIHEHMQIEVRFVTRFLVRQLCWTKASLAGFDHQQIGSMFIPALKRQ
jgi:hypothetical protein